MMALEDLRPPGGWRATDRGEAPSDRPLRTNITLAAECFDCGGQLDVVRSDRFNGGLQMRATVDCTDPACGRRWTVDVTLKGQPKTARPAPPPEPQPRPTHAPAATTPADTTAPPQPPAERSGKRATKSYPAAPVLAYLADTPDGEIADRFGVTRRTVQRWRHGHASIAQSIADRIALELGLHPVNIWPEWEAA